MLQNISVLHFLILAITVGFCVAIIYTNLQRTALSKFITSLIDLSATSKESAKTLNELGLKGVYLTIARSSAKKQFGLKKAVNILCSDNNKDELQNILENGYTEKYYLIEDCDMELLLKKYKYETMPFKKLIIWVISLIAVVVSVTYVSEFVLDIITNKPMDEENTRTEQNTENETDEESNAQDDIGEDVTQSPAVDDDTPKAPTIPV